MGSEVACFIAKEVLLMYLQSMEENLPNIWSHMYACCALKLSTNLDDFNIQIGVVVSIGRSLCTHLKVNRPILFVLTRRR